MATMTSCDTLTTVLTAYGPLFPFGILAIDWAWYHLTILCLLQRLVTRNTTMLHEDKDGTVCMVLARTAWGITLTKATVL
jgi:hypothetical protein